MTPIDLYTWATPNGQKASIALEETGLPYTVTAVDISKNETWTPGYLAMNPNGKIPVIVDSEMNRTVIESGAILLYLAERSGRFVPKLGDETLAWMFFQAAHVGPMLGQLGFFRFAAKEKLPLAIERFEKESLRVLGVLDTRLGQAEYLGGDDFGLADMMNWPWVRSGKIRQGFDFAPWPNLTRWFDAVGAREGVQRGMAVPVPVA